jgi:hypothetical protein
LHAGILSYNRPMPEPLPAAGWFSFASMARAELARPLGLAALSAIAVLALLLPAAVFRWYLPRWLLALPAATLMGAAFWGWMLCYRRLQALLDVPLTRIASAAQGYARLEGHAQSFPGNPLRSPFAGRECCWFSYEVVRYSDDGKVESRESDESEWSFVLRDSSGECVVDPAGARVVPLRLNTYSDRRSSWTERSVLPGDPLCVVGEFSTHTGQNLLARTGDERPFVVSAIDADRLASDLRIWTGLHLACFAAGVAALAWTLARSG